MANFEKTPTIQAVIHRRRANILITQGYISLALRCLTLALVLLVLLTQVFLIAQVSGNDMFPAVKDGDLVFAYRLQSDLSKNDVVVYTLSLIHI